jgi:hypothetical protein
VFVGRREAQEFRGAGHAFLAQLIAIHHGRSSRSCVRRRNALASRSATHPVELGFARALQESIGVSTGEFRNCRKVSAKAISHLASKAGDEREVVAAVNSSRQWLYQWQCLQMVE